MLHATRPNHPTAPHESMLGAQLVLALGAGKLLQARHRHGSTWASPWCCRAGRGVVLAAHGEGGHQVRAPSVRRARRSQLCQTILVSWGAGIRP